MEKNAKKLSFPNRRYHVWILLCIQASFKKLWSVLGCWIPLFHVKSIHIGSYYDVSWQEDSYHLFRFWTIQTRKLFFPIQLEMQSLHESKSCMKMSSCKKKSSSSLFYDNPTLWPTLKNFVQKLWSNYEKLIFV